MGLAETPSDGGGRDEGHRKSRIRNEGNIVLKRHSQSSVVSVRYRVLAKRYVEGT